MLDFAVSRTKRNQIYYVASREEIARVRSFMPNYIGSFRFVPFLVCNNEPLINDKVLSVRC